MVKSKNETKDSLLNQTSLFEGFETEFANYTHNSSDLTEKTTVKTAAKNVQKLHSVKLDSLHDNPEQPRTYIDDSDLDGLAKSIKNYGLLHPILIQINPEGNKMLVAGHRRVLAARKIGLTSLSAVIVSGDPLETALIENLQRSDLSAIDEAEAGM